MKTSRKRQRTGPTCKPSNSKTPSRKGADASWIAALARDAAASSVVSSDGGTALSKEERIERRNAKKRRREGRKVGGAEGTVGSMGVIEDGAHQKEDPQWRRTEGKAALHRIAQDLYAVSRKVCAPSDGEKKKRYHKLWTPPDRDVRGKATAGQKKLTKSALQPRKCDYGGLGLARPSLFLDLHDPSFVPKFEEEFAEHVPGFFGKQRTKAMKKQLDGNMLWRRLADEKRGRKKEDNLSKKVGGKMLADMTPDERVEAMMKAGMI